MTSTHSTFHRYARMMPYILRRWRGLAVILVLTILSASTAALMPWPLKILVDYALGDAALPLTLQTLLNSLSLPSSTIAPVWHFFS